MDSNSGSGYYQFSWMLSSYVVLWLCFKEERDMTTKDYATLECELKALDKNTLCNLISDLMFFDKIDITDINYIYINRLKEKMAEKDRVIFEADKCIFESVFTDSLGKPADKVEPKFKVGDVVTNKKSKDTVKIVQILHDSYCYSGWDGAATVHSDFSISEQDDWELVEQKPAWSEEDDYNLQCCIAKVQNDIDNGRIGRNRELLTWLKFLKDRYTWKPTEAQMKALLYASSVLSDYDSTLTELYNDLKKLKGEE